MHIHLCECKQAHERHNMCVKVRGQGQVSALTCFVCVCSPVPVLQVHTGTQGLQGTQWHGSVYTDGGDSHSYPPACAASTFQPSHLLSLALRILMRARDATAYVCVKPC